MDDPEERSVWRDTARARVARSGATEMFWVLSDMAELALDASQDCPSLDEVPGAGFMVFADPLPPFDIAAFEGWEDVPDGGESCPIPVDAVHWERISRDEARLVLLAKVRRVPPALQVRNLKPDDVQSILSLRVKTPMVFAEGERSQAVSVAAFLSSAWTMMMTPTLAAPRRVDTQTGSTPTQSSRLDRIVTTVGLRPLRTVTSEPGKGTGRPLKVRFYVRGHWTHQPYGPGRTLRRKQWIDPYLKGPEGAPLVARTKVNVWRR